MGSVKEYFSSLGSGIVSLLKGMQVTGKEFLTPKITEKYPEDRETFKWPERFRAILQFVYDKDGRHKCIACGSCERACPNQTIRIESKMVDTPAGTKKKKLVNYYYDLGSCTFCDLCVKSCPTQAIEFSNDFEQAVFTRNVLVKKLNDRPEPPEPELTPEQLAKIQAEKEAKIAAAKAAMAAKKAAQAAAGGAASEAKPAAPATEAPKQAAPAEAAKPTAKPTDGEAK